MSRVIQSRDSNGIVNTLVLEEGDLAILEKLRNKRSGEVKITISAASIAGDTAFITKDRRIYEIQRKDLPF